MSYNPPGGAPPPPPPGWQQPQPAAPYPASGYGYPGYGYAPPVQAKPLKGLATATMILLGISGLAAMVGLFALLHRASVVDDFSSISSISDLQDADDQVSGSLGFFQLSLLATAVLWIIWQFRHAKNAQTLRGNYGLTPGWAIGGWFVPVGNLVLPQLQLFQATKASDPDLPAGRPASEGKPVPVVPAWWAVYSLAVVLIAAGAVVRPDLDDFNPDVDRFIQADRISALAMLAYLVAAILAIVLVRAATSRQERALLSISSGPQPQGYGQPMPAPPGQAAPPLPQSWPPQPAPPPPQPPQQQWPPPPGAPPPQ